MANEQRMFEEERRQLQTEMEELRKQAVIIKPVLYPFHDPIKRHLGTPQSIQDD